ncbi:hypothetical protein GCM10027073_35180 [Streptomyces chlorus]|uniref:Uncharacterized protein n=1 Tax=Streptomyces chlorus TaxID=887452 RepID=A0ABW1DZ32_9ACTN
MDVTLAHSNHCHVALRAGFASSGLPVFETLPARTVGPGSCELMGGPGMVEGCADGDLLKIGDDGPFQIERRGPSPGPIMVRGLRHLAVELSGCERDVLELLTG